MPASHAVLSIVFNASRRLTCLSLSATLLFGIGCERAQDASDSAVDVRVETDQAEAVLHILLKGNNQEDLEEQDWSRLKASEGYVRLKQRQESFGATEFDERFRSFLDSGASLERWASLRKALDVWDSIPIDDVAQRALEYLPADARIEATIYPVIKQSSNSFVFELDSDPAIFMFVDPEMTAAELDNTLTHELHHVGAADCDEPDGTESASPAVKRVMSWLSAFSEGLAVLAAAGSPNVHPHSSSKPEAWLVWERDVANFNRDLRRIETFFQAILEGTLAEAEQREGLFRLINTDDVPQGPFYTVGWKMASVVEQALGREAVVAAVCDPRILLSTYNRVVKGREWSTSSLAIWSESFLASIEAIDSNGLTK